MSQHHTEKMRCPKCGAQGEMTIWDSINVQLNPELKEGIMDESLFFWTCPDCGHKVYVTFGTLYHDVGSQFMLFFDHKTEDNDISEDAFPDSEEFQQFNKNYRLRYVHGIHALKEKIFIFDEGLSDIVVELLKYFVRNQVIRINESDPNFLIGKAIYFTNLSDDGEQLIFAIVSARKGVVAHFALSMDLYEQCLQKSILDERFKQEKNCIMNVCYEWIDAKLKSAK